MSHRSFKVTACAISSLAVGVLGCGSSASPAGATAPAAAADAASAPSADPGYSVQDGNNLPVPATADGIQLETPDYDANNVNAAHMIVQPNQEIFLCYYITLPNKTELDVGQFQSWMSPGSSHHFIVYEEKGGSVLNATPQPSGSIQSCGVASGNWVYATSTPGAIVSSTMPAGVGLPFAAGEQIVLNMHFINTGSTALYPKVKLNILTAKNVQYKAGALVSFNTSINVPAATPSGPGKQTVNGTCTVTAGSKIFSMSTHTHKHATAALVNFVSGGVSQEIVHTGITATYPAEQRNGTGTDWEHPGVSLWKGPDFLTANSGDSFTYSCSYENTASSAVTVGETAASNEMCMAVGYYYPAGTVSCQDTASSN
jgi:hypothetical protein